MVIDKGVTSLKGIDFKEGHIILIDKPLTWTSFDVVGKLRYKICRTINEKKLKVGHGGTLDPLATGLMIIAVGKATKQLQTYQDEPKQYIAEVKFGATTPSYDGETEENEKFPCNSVTKESIEKSLKENFLGDILQAPPLYSAKWVDGVRAYEHAREGKDIELKENNITIHSSTLIEYSEPLATISIHCSKGTYIRSIARDLGASLQSGAYLTGLIRTQSGGYNLENALKIEDFLKLLDDL